MKFLDVWAELTESCPRALLLLNWDRQQGLGNDRARHGARGTEKVSAGR